MLLIQQRNVLILPILSLIGCVTNSLSIMVFSLIIKNGQRDDMYKYLLMKSICEALGCFSNIFGAIYYGDRDLANTFIMVVWFIWFKEYIIPSLFMASTGFEIAAAFSCAISIEKRMKWCEKRLSFWIWVISILILSFGVEMFPIFMYSINEFESTDQFNNTIILYTAYPNSNIFKIGEFGLGESIIKEITLLLILLSLNCYILFKLIQIGRRKKRLNTNSLNIQNSNRAENRKITMIIILFLTFFLGHLPNVVYFAVNSGYRSTLSWAEFKFYGEIFLYFSFATSFFVYFAFNNIFRRLLLRILHF
jgi:hypothetical protein